MFPCWATDSFFQILPKDQKAPKQLWSLFVLKYSHMILKWKNFIACLHGRQRTIFSRLSQFYTIGTFGHRLNNFFVYLSVWQFPVLKKSPPAYFGVPPFLEFPVRSSPPLFASSPPLFVNSPPLFTSCLIELNLMYHIFHNENYMRTGNSGGIFRKRGIGIPPCTLSNSCASYLTTISI